MELNKEIGKMFCVGFDGFRVNDEIRTLIHDYNVGSIILFSRNIKSLEQVKELTEDLQFEAEKAGYKEPLLICIDQENGTVRRILDDNNMYPGPMALAASRKKENTYEVFKETSLFLNSLGINWNLVPVLDVNSNAKNPIIGTRAFSDDVDMVIEYGIESLKGTRDGGCLNSIKHYPGHGDTSVDSHLALPYVDKSYEELWYTELKPFNRVIKEGLVDSVMVSHLVMEQLDTNPASQSKVLVQKILRGEMDYQGVAVTDCMEMDAISKGVGVKEGTIKAIEAGIDIVMISHTLDLQIEAIKNVFQKASKDDSFRKKIELSLERIQNLNKRLLNPISSVKTITDDIFYETFTIIKNNRTMFDKEKEIIVLFPTDPLSLRVEDVSLAYNFKDIFSPLGKNVIIREYNNTMSPEKIQNIINDVEKFEQVLICTINLKDNIPANNLLKINVNHKEWLILKNPYDLMYEPMDSFESVILCYEPTPIVLSLVAKEYYNKEKFTGKLPVKI